MVTLIIDVGATGQIASLDKGLGLNISTQSQDAKMVAAGDLTRAEIIYVRAEACNVEHISALSRKWKILSAEDRCSEPFFQPEWFSAYARAFEPQTPLMLFSVWKGKTLRGVLPLVWKRHFSGGIPARTLRSLSGIHSCRFDLIHGSDDMREVAEQMWHALRKNDQWEVIEISDVPEGGAFEHVVKYAEEEGFYTGKWPTRKSPFLPISPEEADPFAHCPELTKGTRSRLRNYQKKLERIGRLSFNIVTSADRGVLDEFYRLEASGWKGRAGSAISQHENIRFFYDCVAQSAAERGVFRMYALASGEQTVAMEFGLLMDGCYYSPKAAYSEEYRSYSPGHLLVKHIITDLWKSGVKKYDFLGPLAKYKCVWTPEVRAHNNLYVFRPGPKGRILHLASIKSAALLRRWKYKVFGDPQDVHR